jgi:preprotein translocase subunit SecB
METTTQPGIAVGQVFLERMSFGHRPDFLALPPDTKPDVGVVAIELHVGESSDGAGGLIRIEVRTDPARNPTYNVELAMVALVRRLPGEGSLPVRDFVLSAASVSLLYPFVREAFAAVTLRGRFGPVWLNLLNPQALAAGLTAATPADAAPPPVRSDAGAASPDMKSHGARRRGKRVR